MSEANDDIQGSEGNIEDGSSGNDCNGVDADPDADVDVEEGGGA